MLWVMWLWNGVGLLSNAEPNGSINCNIINVEENAIIVIEIRKELIYALIYFSLVKAISAGSKSPYFKALDSHTVPSVKLSLQSIPAKYTKNRITPARAIFWVRIWLIFSLSFSWFENNQNKTNIKAITFPPAVVRGKIKPKETIRYKEIFSLFFKDKYTFNQIQKYLSYRPCLQHP